MPFGALASASALEFASFARRDACSGIRVDQQALQEYVNALFIDFDKADTDKDGSLTFEEIQVYSRTTGR